MERKALLLWLAAIPASLTICSCIALPLAGATNGDMGAMLTAFSLHLSYFASVIILVRVFHRESLTAFLQLTGKPKEFLLCLAISLASFFLFSLKSMPIARRTDFSAFEFFAASAPLLLLVPTQALSEEIFFRFLPLKMFFSGKKATKAQAISFSLVLAILFTLMHLMNSELEDEATRTAILLYYFISGFMLSILMFQTGGIAASFAFHAANNLFAFIVLGYEGMSVGKPLLMLPAPDVGILSFIPMALYPIAVTHLLKRR